jgi:hypothetical protein
MADVPIYANDDSNLADAGKVFITNFEVASIGTTEIPIALFRNPSGSGKLAKLIRITLTNFTTVNSFVRVRAYIAPTVTSDGTALTESCTLIGGSTSVSETFSSPTVSANGTRASQWALPSFANALIIPLDQLIIIPANVSLLITAQADGTNRTVGASVVWAEV